MDFYIVILAFLVLLAIFDLFVGVSNDGVNFLGQALGCRIASFRTVMIVAAAGVLIGATFSSGMMEIARSGVFDPAKFTFSEIIVIFFAVMVTDVILLDIFNSFGLPTSTTVSIVFELLGGAVAGACYKIYTTGGSLLSVVNYINSDKALAIISGILISVVVAFVAGVVVQYITRLIFSFRYEAMYRRIGGIFGGIALTAIFYFLVMKGAKGSSFMHKEYIDWINANTWTILLTLFVGLSVLLQVLIRVRNTNVFRIIILSGTFSLAFAFAGNDLVNFVGVPLAALDSYKHYMASGAAANLFTMEGLKQAVQTPTIFLLLSGLVMVLTLFFSKKAHHVVRTSIKLASSTRGEQEQFGSSLPARVVVRSAMRAGDILHQIIPSGVMSAISSRMEPAPLEKGQPELPFDYVRASINLVVSAILIASATSLKLPLSTTYVTFMVAMGSSFADGAWDRESAVYRISGVLTVISGWFMTAISAFTLCFVVATIVLIFGETSAIVLMLLASALLIRSNFFSRQHGESSVEIMAGEMNRAGICARLDEARRTNLNETVRLFCAGLEGFLDEDGKAAHKASLESVSLFDTISRSRGQYYSMAFEGPKLEDDVRHFYYRAFSNMKEVGHSLRATLGMLDNHLANQHRVYTGELRDNLLALLSDIKLLRAQIDKFGSNGSTEDSASLTDSVNQVQARISQCQLTLLKHISEEKLSLRSSELYLSLLQFTRDLLNRYSLVAIIQRELNAAGAKN
ncbi:MAG: inorganic phosphate transporter [Desulfovibrionaceae bacterium]|nr:inorganic phosphate transporter [Desulfovibrionaceae bacterium]